MGDARSFIEHHGGVRKTAKRYGFPVSTVSEWKSNNRIPAWRVAQINEIDAQIAAKEARK